MCVTWLVLFRTHFQSLQDFAILRSMYLSLHQANSTIFARSLKCSQLPPIFVLDVSRDVIAACIQSKKGCFSVWKMEWTALRSHHDRFTRATLDNRTESGTNPRYSFGLRGADCLSARAGAVGCSRSRDTVIHSTGRYSEESSRIHSRINNIKEAFEFGAEFC